VTGVTVNPPISNLTAVGGCSIGNTSALTQNNEIAALAIH